MRHDGLSIGRLATLTAVNLETIRYYERIGLMPEPERTTGGHRLYRAAHRDRLTFVRRARELGFTIEDVRALLALSDPCRRSCKDVAQIAAAHLAQVRAKIVDLQRLEGLLAGALSGCGPEQSPSCSVLDMLEQRSGEPHAEPSGPTRRQPSARNQTEP